MTPAHHRLLQDMSEADVFVLAAFREPESIMKDGRYFPGAPAPGHPRLFKGGEGMRRCISPGTFQTAFEAGHVGHEEGDTGDREFRLSDAGRSALG